MKSKPLKKIKKMADIWGGLIEVMYTTYQESEIPEHIKTLKRRLDLLYNCKNLEEIKEHIFFSKTERNYLNSPLLDSLWLTIFSDDPARKSVIENKIDALKFYLNINGNKQPSDALTIAVGKGYEDMVEFLLKNRTINQGAEIYYKAVWYACRKNQVGTLKILLKYVDISSFSAEPLSYAAGSGYFEIVKLLLENKIPKNEPNNFSLRDAATNGYLEIVKLLLDHGVTVHKEYALSNVLDKFNEGKDPVFGKIMMLLL